jgi:ubiquinone/menaquinone biosynthesis C-methylase UbiE
VDPRAVRLFERQWLVNLILWGNFARLRDAALEALGDCAEGRTLQVACVYGNLTEKLARQAAHLDVVDVLPVQLDNLARKLVHRDSVKLMHADSTALPMESGTYDRALLFFLLHEQPDAARRATLAEAMRVVRPGGRVVIVDYHRPHPLNPLYWPMVGILRTLEPYALALWRQQIAELLPRVHVGLKKQTSFGGLYQLVTLRL